MTADLKELLVDSVTCQPIQAKRHDYISPASLDGVAGDQQVGAVEPRALVTAGLVKVIDNATVADFGGKLPALSRDAGKRVSE